MRLAYVDTSCLVAIAFGEPGARKLATRMTRFDRLVSSNLLEAELRSTMTREAADVDPGPMLAALTWV